MVLTGFVYLSDTLGKENEVGFPVDRDWRFFGLLMAQFLASAHE